MPTPTLIPLNKLIVSLDNVRKTGLKDGITALATSIEAHGLLNNLVVIPTEGDLFEVVAGGRRLAALKLLAKGKKVATDMPVPCNVLPPGASATEISLTENELRSAMHPADQYQAFKALVDEGQGDETIAARFGVTPAVVRQRLKLAVVSPTLMAIFRKGDMALEQLMAFTLTDDHKAQEKVWLELPSWAKERGDEQPIRAALTKAHTEADGKLARFVTLEAYENAGGAVMRDMFADEDDAGWLTDIALVNRLAAEKLDAAAATIRAEGWKWVEAAPDIGWEQRQKDTHLPPQYAEPTEQATAKADELQAEGDRLMEEHGEEPADAAVHDRLSAIQDEIDALTEREAVFTETQKAVSGVYVCVGHNGEIAITRGVVKPEDKAAARRLSGAGQGDGESQPDPVEKPKTGISAALLTELTSHKTVAAQLTLAQEPAIGLLAVTHALAVRLLYDYSGSGHSALVITPHRPTYTIAVREAVDASAPAKKLAAIIKGWTKKLPKEPGDLWAYLAKQKPEALQALLAVCAAMTVDMVQVNGAGATVASGELCKTLELDLASHWTATADSYFSRVPKKHLLAELNGTLTPEQAKQIDGMKRDQASKTLEGIVKGKRWLPEALRT